MEETIAANKADALWKDTWNNLDYHEENSSLKFSSDVELLLEQLLNQTKQTGEELEMPGDDDDEGFVFGDNFTVENIASMLAFFKEGGKVRLSDAMNIVAKTKDVLEKNTSGLATVQIPKNGRLTILGDLHGQLEDLVTIFKLNGLPSTTNAYLFNGDFVDRGNFGIEILLVLFALKVALPNHVHLNRGNHEEKGLNRKYGFAEEVKSKYDRHLYHRILSAFSKLPLSSLIEKEILILHGGLFTKDGVKLEDISKIQLPRDLPKGDREGDDKLMEDILWSDPAEIDDRAESSRGAGIKFGKNVSRAFLQENSLKMLIRSHEMVDEGYQVLHDGLVVTIFSCSRYCGTNENKGGFIVFHDGENLNPRYHSYYADPLNDEMQEKHDQVKEKCQKQTLQKLKEMIFHHRFDLLFCYTQMDIDKSGEISIAKWVEGVESVFPDLAHVPWAEIQPYLVTANSQGRINYHKFIDSFQIQSSAIHWGNSIMKKICSKIYEKSASLTKEFERLDADHDGKLSFVEFAEAFKNYNISLSKEQLYDLAKSIDEDGNHVIDFKEFFDYFKPHFESVLKDYENDKKWAQTIADMLAKEHLSLKKAFKKFDTDKDHGLSFEEFFDMLKKLGLNLSKDEATRIAKYVDSNGSGSINYHEFKEAFSSIEFYGDKSWMNKAIQQIAGIFSKHKDHLSVLFQEIDLDNSGTINFEEFKIGLKALQVLTEMPLSEEQMLDIFNEVDGDGSGEIDYKEFLNKFEVYSKYE